MKRSQIISRTCGLIAFLGLFSLLALLQSRTAQAQGFSIGPNGVSVGGAYIPFNNGPGYYDNGRGYPYDRGGYYGTRGPRDYFDRGYYGRGSGRNSLYWTPGMYWTPNEYWYGDQNWSRYDSGNSRAALNGSRGGILSDLGARLDIRPELPPVPTLEELERMDWVHLRRVLSYGATQLEQELAQQKTGSQWLEYLRVERLKQIADEEANDAPTSEQADELVVMLERYNQTAEDQRYVSITDQWGYATVHRALAEFLVNPASRYRRQLVMNSEDLDRALEKFKTGAGWQHHLMLPAELFLDPVEADKNPPDPEAMRKALQRFDEVAKNRDYRVVNELPAFKATHDSLARYLGRAEPSGTITAKGNAPAPPADPSLNEPKPIDPLLGPSVATEGEDKDAKPSKKPGEQKSILKPSKPQVEELVAPSSDPPVENAPAVREKK